MLVDSSYLESISRVLDLERLYIELPDTCVETIPEGADGDVRLRCIGVWHVRSHAETLEGELSRLFNGCVVVQLRGDAREKLLQGHVHLSGLRVLEEGTQLGDFPVEFEETSG